MACHIQKLLEKRLIEAPPLLHNTVQYETIMGSLAYGVSNEASDLDIYAFCIPPKEVVFPHLRGEIFGFGTQQQRFEQYQNHGIELPDERRVYDITCYNIVKYFQLCMENNPNMIDSLFTPQRAVTHCTQIGNLVRENRRLFLHKGAWFKFKGYAYSQLHKISTKAEAKKSGKRRDDIEKYGYDVKFAYHTVRLLNEIEQILIEGDLDLTRNREQLKSIRDGMWTLAEIQAYFTKKESELETAYTQSTLPKKPPETHIKQLLLNCLESYYGSLDNMIVAEDRYLNALKEIQAVLRNYNI